MSLSLSKASLLTATIVISATMPLVTWAGSPSVDDRIKRLENILENELNFDLLTQLEAMQQEVRELRGKIEEQQNEIQVLTKKQEKLYLSLETRIDNLAPAKTATPIQVQTQPQPQTRTKTHEQIHSKLQETKAESQQELKQQPETISSSMDSMEVFQLMEQDLHIEDLEPGQ